LDHAFFNFKGKSSLFRLALFGYFLVDAATAEATSFCPCFV
jgi:hypothetical protein